MVRNPATSLVPCLMTPRELPVQSGPPSNDGYQGVFDCNPTPMWVFDLDTHRFLAVNAAAVAEYGYPPEKFLTLTIRDIYEEADRARFDDALAGDAQDLYSGLWVHRRQNGTSLQVEIRSNDLPFEGRRARLIHATNVTARLQAESARRESEEFLGAIVESSDDAILSKTPDGRILTWSAAAERMYGHTSKEAIGASIFLIVPPEGHAELAGHMETVCKVLASRRTKPYASIKTGGGSRCGWRFHPS